MNLKNELTAEQLEHLKAHDVTTFKQMEKLAEFQKVYRENFPDVSEPCYECKNISRKLNLEV